MSKQSKDNKRVKTNITIEANKEEIKKIVIACKHLAVELIDMANKHSGVIEIEHPHKFKKRVKRIENIEEVTMLEKELEKSSSLKKNVDNQSEQPFPSKVCDKLAEERRSGNKKRPYLKSIYKKLGMEDGNSFIKFMSKQKFSKMVKKTIIPIFEPTENISRLLQLSGDGSIKLDYIDTLPKISSKTLHLTYSKKEFTAMKNALKSVCKKKDMKDLKKLFKNMKRAKKEGYSILYLTNFKIESLCDLKR